MKAKRFLLIPILVLSLLTQACGAANFAKALTNILDAADPFIDSLPLPESVRLGLVVDFKDLARGGGAMGTEIDACAKAKPCELASVDKFAVLFESVYHRGHLGANEPRLQRVVKILRGIIASAKLYYSFAARDVGGSRPVTKEDIDRQLKELKASMK